MVQKLWMVLAFSLLLACQKTENVAPTPLPPLSDSFALISSSNFTSLNGYTVTGKLDVWKDGNQYEFRFIDFFASNGPDVDVWITTGQSTSSFIDLGDIKGHDGNFSYAYTDTDNRLKDFSSVLIWCKRFSRGFGIANFNQ